MSFEEDHTAIFLCFSSSSNPRLLSPVFTLYTVRKDFMDPPNEDIKYDLQRLLGWLEGSAKTYRLCRVVFPSSFSTQVKDVY